MLNSLGECWHAAGRARSLAFFSLSFFFVPAFSGFFFSQLGSGLLALARPFVWDHISPPPIDFSDK